jgi:RND family efflux transporter MFP subunit
MNTSLSPWHAVLGRLPVPVPFAARVVAVVVAAGILACACGMRAADAAVPLKVPVSSPAPGDIVRYVTLPGNVRASQQATLYAKVGGYLRSLAVDKGDRVQAGQVLGEIEVPELVADRARHQAEVVRAEAELKVAEIEVGRLAKAQGKAPDLVLPQAVDAAEGRLAMAKAGLGLARASLERADTLLGYARVTAPFGGVVTARFVDPGAYIPAATSGTAAGTAALVSLADFQTVRVQVAVPETEAGLVRVGQPVLVTVEAWPGRTLTGAVSRLGYALDEATRTMALEADLPNPEWQLRPGMYATVRVGVERRSGVPVLPVEALVMEKANAFVFLLVDGKARKTPVKVGFNDGARFEVLDGVPSGARVIGVGRRSLADGQAVAEEAKP